MSGSLICDWPKTAAALGKTGRTLARIFWRGKRPLQPPKLPVFTRYFRRRGRNNVLTRSSASAGLVR